MDLIDQLSEKISNKLDGFEYMPKKDVINYSTNFLLTNILTIVLLIVGGLVFNNLENVIIASVSFAVLRRFAGGYHIKSSDICVFVSVTSMILIASFAPLLINFRNIMTGISVISILVFAPSNIEHSSRLDKKYYPILKLVSVLIIILSVCLQNIYITTSLLFESVLLIRLKGGERK